MSIFEHMIGRRCPVCDAGPESASLFRSASIRAEDLSAFTFASRKTPEFMSLNLVKCGACATVYATEAPPESALSEAYSDAAYDSSAEAALAAESYIRALRPHLRLGGGSMSALEIGAGTGVFLERLMDAGFGQVVGVEPSVSAIMEASPRVPEHIRTGIFNCQDFEEDSFDLICCFQTLEHVADPRAIA